MSEQRDFDRFLKGEIRVDGWKSDWRKGFDAYMDSRSISPKVKIAPAKRTYAKPGMANAEYMRRRRVEMKKKGICTDCYKAPARTRKTTCQPCQDRRTQREVKRYHERKAA